MTVQKQGGQKYGLIVMLAHVLGKADIDHTGRVVRIVRRRGLRHRQPRPEHATGHRCHQRQRMFHSA